MAAVAVGCGGSDRVALEVSPALSLADEPVQVAVSGLQPRALVTITLSSTDAAGTKWGSAAAFRADAGGRVHLDRAVPVSGDYGDAWAAGLFASLRPVRGIALYKWSGARPRTFTVSVRAGMKVLASTTFKKRLTRRPLVRERRYVAADGFFGEYVAPRGLRERPAILAFGGSEGGLAHVTLATHLAARGYPTLTIAYFGERGLPQYLYRIRLEYFVRALRWLARQPEVDADRIFVLGISRGSEAAQLLGVHFPDLVHGVVASVPSNVVIAESWSLRGRVLPGSRSRQERAARHAIPVERIRGPVFATCGGNDFVWPSCTYARLILERLRRFNHPYEDVLVEVPAGSHYVGNLVPYTLASATDSRVDEQGRERIWRRLLAFLEAAA